MFWKLNNHKKTRVPNRQARHWWIWKAHLAILPNGKGNLAKTKINKTTWFLYIKIKIPTLYTFFPKIHFCLHLSKEINSLKTYHNSEYSNLFKRNILKLKNILILVPQHVVWSNIFSNCFTFLLKFLKFQVRTNVFEEHCQLFPILLYKWNKDINESFWDLNFCRKHFLEGAFIIQKRIFLCVCVW